MHRYHKYAATAAWPVSAALFVAALFEENPVARYNLYAVGVFAGLAAVTFTCLAALESVVARNFQREARASREQLAQSIAVGLADELEKREAIVRLRSVR